MKSFVFILLIRLVIDFIEVSCNDDFLFDLFSSTSTDNQGSLSINNQSTNNEFNQSISFIQSNPINLSNLTQYQINESSSIKTNLKLKKQKLFFGKKILLWKRNTNRGYGAFLMLCEPDITCVTPQTKLANCMNSGGSALANQLYNSCSNQNRIQCTDQDVARRLLGCLRLQSANNVLISAQSRACVRQVVTLGTLDCFVRILRQKPKFRSGIRYSTVVTDGGAGVTAAGMGEGMDPGIEDPDSDGSPNSVRKLVKREQQNEPLEYDRIDNLVDNKKLDLESSFQTELVTLNYDEDIFSDLNRTFINDTFNDDNYENDSFNEVMDLTTRNNITTNDTIDDEFEEIVDVDEDDEALSTINSSSEVNLDVNYLTISPILNDKNNSDNDSNKTIDRSIDKDTKTNKIEFKDKMNRKLNNPKLNRSKRQCNNNRHIRYNNRRFNRRRDRSGRSNSNNRRPNYHPYNNLKEKNLPFDDDKKWELIDNKNKNS